MNLQNFIPAQLETPSSPSASPVHITRASEPSILVLTLIPSQRDTARSGRNARRVRIDRNAGMSAAPTMIAARLISES